MTPPTLADLQAPSNSMGDLGINPDHFIQRATSPPGDRLTVVYWA